MAGRRAGAAARQRVAAARLSEADKTSQAADGETLAAAEEQLKVVSDLLFLTLKDGTQTLDHLNALRRQKNQAVENSRHGRCPESTYKPSGIMAVDASG